MKSLLALVLAVAFLVFTVIVFAEEKAYVPKDNEEIYGTWVNEKYDSTKWHARWDIKSDGTWASYQNSNNTKPAWRGTYSIVQKWADKGKVWYKITFKNQTYNLNCYALTCLSDSGSTMESAHSLKTHRAKIDRELNFPDYAGIHYRKNKIPAPKKITDVR